MTFRTLLKLGYFVVMGTVVAALLPGPVVATATASRPGRAAAGAGALGAAAGGAGVAGDGQAGATTPAATGRSDDGRAAGGQGPAPGREADHPAPDGVGTPDDTPTLRDAPAAVYNVRDYGAVGNGSTLDDDAIDRAIELAPQALGARVAA